ncbi:MAG: phosphatidylserine decarboxylase family protein [Bacteroidota bacterium]
MITRYGFDVFFTITTLCLILAVIAFMFIEPKAVRSTLIIISIALFGFTLIFFRDPDRITPIGQNFIIAPADGEVIALKKVYESEFLKDDAQQISIFMSPLNVHVNRNPISGIVAHLRYVKGEYFAANADKASERNEQMIVGMQNTQGKVLFKQIAGFIARRIVCTLKEKDSVTMGERFGMIKFGSRVDVFVPKNAVINVEVGQQTRAGETILAEFSDAQKGAQSR